MMIHIQELNVHLGMVHHGQPSNADALGLLSSIFDQGPRTAQNQASKAPFHAAVPDLGAHWAEQGGTYLGTMRGIDGKPSYHLIVADTDAGITQGVKWGGYGEDLDGAKCRRDGLANTLALIGDPNGTDHPAAQWAHGLVIGDHSDFYLPSQAEAQLGVIHAPHLFAEGVFWTSTQYSAGNAWVQYADGNTNIRSKNDEFKARAFRRSLIE